MCSRDLVVTSPATVVDLAEAFGSDSYATWVLARRQIATGSSWAISSNAGIVALGGLVRDGDWWEAWFWPTPLAPSRMVRVLRLVRLTLRAHAHDRVYAVIRSDAGRRIARLSGFHPFGIVKNCEVWAHG